jgi:DNA polymerase-3 subunit gamma/tau
MGVEVNAAGIDDEQVADDGAQRPENFFDQDGPGLFGDSSGASEPTVAADEPAPEVKKRAPRKKAASAEDDTAPAKPKAVAKTASKTTTKKSAKAVETVVEAQPQDAPEPEAAPVVAEMDSETATEPAQPAPATPAPALAPKAAAFAAATAPLALYRRYRPDNFDEIIGQEHVTEPLKRALTNGKINHAYLFSGPRGCGKTTSARILARCLNCEQGPTPTPCGVCQSCRDLATGGPGSVDVIEIDAASHGQVDDARDLRDRAYFVPVSSRFKVYIIDEAHMVTPQGFNALLKVVEEPPPHVKFIFATTEPEKVMVTIRSRTHHYPFRLVPPKVLQNYLETICTSENIAVEPGALQLVVRAGAGSVRDSLSVLDQLLGSADAQGVSYASAAALLGFTPDWLLDEIIDALGDGSGEGVFSAIDKVIEVGQDPRRFTEDLLQRLRDLIIISRVPDAVSSGLIDVSPDQGERLRDQAEKLGRGELTRAAEVVAEGLTQMRGTTAPRLYLELMCARVLLPNADTGQRAWLARLEKVEKQIAAGVPVGAPTGALASAPAAMAAPTPSIAPTPPTSPVVASPPARPPQTAPAPTGQRPPVAPRPPVSGQSSQPVAPAPAGLAQTVPASPAPTAPTQTAQIQPPTAQALVAGAAPVVAPSTPPEPRAASVTDGVDPVAGLWAKAFDVISAQKVHFAILRGWQPLEADGSVFVLQAPSPELLNTFNQRGTAQVVAAALQTCSGRPWQVRAVVKGLGGPSPTPPVGSVPTVAPPPTIAPSPAPSSAPVPAQAPTPAPVPAAPPAPAPAAPDQRPSAPLSLTDEVRPPSQQPYATDVTDITPPPSAPAPEREAVHSTPTDDATALRLLQDALGAPDPEQ